MYIWMAIVVGIIISILIIETVSSYRFDAQLGMGIFIWGFLVSLLLAIIGGLHNLILFLISDTKRN